MRHGRAIRRTRAIQRERTARYPVEINFYLLSCKRRRVIMRMGNLPLSLLIAAATVSAAAVAEAATSVNIDINIGPPPPPVVVVPALRPGYAWAPGYWHWDGRRHVWREGRWIRERPGYVWVPD